MRLPLLGFCSYFFVNWDVGIPNGLFFFFQALIWENHFVFPIEWFLLFSVPKIDIASPHFPLPFPTLPSNKTILLFHELRWRIGNQNFSAVLGLFRCGYQFIFFVLRFFFWVTTQLEDERNFLVIFFSPLLRSCAHLPLLLVFCCQYWEVLTVTYNIMRLWSENQGDQIYKAKKIYQAFLRSTFSKSISSPFLIWFSM